MKYTQQAIDLITKFEGFSPTNYKCPSGYSTIGYGHRITSTKLQSISKYEGLILLKKDLLICSIYLNQHINITLTQNMHDALCSLIYNWGCKNFNRSKGLILLNRRKYKQASYEFFSKEKGVVNIKNNFSYGLYRRRQEELNLWNKLT